MSRIPTVAILMMLIMCTSRIGYASDFYEWTDENGVTHFADSPDAIPAKYRSQVKPPKPDHRTMPAVSHGTIAANPAGSNDTASPTSTGEAQQPSRRFEVPYEASEGSAGRVIITVTLNDAVTVPMALDTGSPGMVVSFELAERLGLFSKDNGTLLVAAAGIGGMTPGVLTVVDAVSVEGARAAFVPTTVTGSLSPAFEGLIGMDFMSGYTVSIDSSRRVVVFQENAPGRDARGGHDEEWWRKTFKEFRSTRDRWIEYAESAGPRLGSRAKVVADFQARESERLVQRLSSYASDNAVPQEWR